MEGFVVHVAPEARPRRWLQTITCLALATVGLVALVALVGSGAAGTQSRAQVISWEQRSSRGYFRDEDALLKKAVRSGPKPALKAARFQSLGGIYADMELIPIHGTRYDDGCDRAATTGCKGEKMWVPKGADYSLPEPDAEVSVAQLNAEAGTETPELENLDAPAADHTAEVEDILSTEPADTVLPEETEPAADPAPAAAAEGCDALMHDLDAWLQCEMMKY